MTMMRTLFTGLFGVLFSAFTLVFDFILLHGLFRPDSASLALKLDPAVVFYAFVFMVPFNAAMIACVVVIVAFVRNRFSPNGGVEVIREADGIHVRLPKRSPFMRALITVSALAPLLGLLVLWITNSVALHYSVYFTVFAAGLAVYFWQRRHNRSGIRDLIIDEKEQCVTLPRRSEAEPRVSLPLKKIESVFVWEIVISGGRGRPTYEFSPTLQTSVGKGLERYVRLAAWTDQKRAEIFAKWLSQQIGRPNGSTHAVWKKIA